ncbi:MAG: holo-ACP synthase [Alphaproteobacteria bacterium]|tara:strand:- start:500 stop:889 length:390 start_codon:yes stop_codon:yes gene_type:complete
MIFGIGQDLCDSKRIEATLEKHGERFKARIYTKNEIKKCDSRKNYADSYARRFAAKEACSKALGTGFKRGVFYKDIEVVNLRSGKPTIILKGGALEQFKLITKNDKSAKIDISLTDDSKLAMAIVIISN